MKNQKGNTVILIILAIVVLLLAGYLVYDKVFLKENESIDIDKENTEKIEKLEEKIINIEREKEKVEYTFENISGLYQYSDDNVSYILYLWKNGTFKYEYSDLTAPRGYIGNYTISENNINLNYLFLTGSDTSLRVAQGNKILNINEDNSITDSNTLLEQRKVDLKKATNQEENEYIEKFNIYKIMNNADLVNHQ